MTMKFIIKTKPYSEIVEAENAEDALLKFVDTIMDPDMHAYFQAVITDAEKPSRKEDSIWPKLLEPLSTERDNLDIAAKLIASSNNRNLVCRTEDIYFDYGANIKWTTIVAYDLSKDSSWQMLSLDEWGKIILASTSEEIEETVTDYMRKHDLI